MSELPATLRLAVAVVAGEGALVTVLVALLLYADLTQAAGSATGAAAVTFFAGALAGLLVGLSLALARRRRWARGPAIVLQLLALPIGFTMATGGAPWEGALTLLLGASGTVLLLAPDTRTALG